MQLEEIIEYSYKLFEKYTIGSTLDVCKRCCVSDADEAILINTPLRPRDFEFGFEGRVFCFGKKLLLPRVIGNEIFPAENIRIGE